LVEAFCVYGARCKSKSIRRNIMQHRFPGKLDEANRNPCQGKWSLAADFALYSYSSAAYYEQEEENKWVTDYRETYC